MIGSKIIAMVVTSSLRLASGAMLSFIYYAAKVQAIPDVVSTTSKPPSISPM